jgi:hypothetical protein
MGQYSKGGAPAGVPNSVTNAEPRRTLTDGHDDQGLTSFSNTTQGGPSLRIDGSTVGHEISQA